MSLTIWCPAKSCFKSYLCCLYACKSSVRKTCGSYKENFEAISKEEIPESYKEKYGEVRLYNPNITKRKRGR